MYLFYKLRDSQFEFKTHLPALNRGHSYSFPYQQRIHVITSDRFLSIILYIQELSFYLFFPTPLPFELQNIFYHINWPQLDINHYAQLNRIYQHSFL